MAEPYSLNFRVFTVKLVGGCPKISKGTLRYMSLSRPVEWITSSCGLIVTRRERTYVLRC